MQMPSFLIPVPRCTISESYAEDRFRPGGPPHEGSNAPHAFTFRISIRRSTFDFQAYLVFFNDQWLKSGIPGAFVAKIGYLSISVFATPPGRHLIGQRRPSPDDGHISAG